MLNLRWRPRAAWLVLACLLAATAASQSVAAADVTTDINNWSLTTSVSSYGGGTQFHISQGGSPVDYRWLDDDMTKTTVISGNSCSDYFLLGNSTYDGGDTSYHRLFNGFAGQCFVLRGRTTGGTTIPHDGRLRR